MKKPRKINLGREVFVLSNDGEVVRTMVAKIGPEGHYALLNGIPLVIWDNPAKPSHWFTFEDALAAAQERIKIQMARLQKQLAALTKRSIQMEAEEAKTAVMGAPYKVADLSGNHPPRRTRQLKKVVIPVNYLNPGSTVYVCITPQTKNPRLGYRPHKLFVLETKIKEVSFDPKGVLRYTYTTPFKVERHFALKSEAGDFLRKHYPNEQIGFVPHEEEKEKIRIMMEAIEEEIPF